MTDVEWDATLGKARESLMERVRFVTGERLECPRCGERVEIGERREDGVLVLTAHCPRDEAHVAMEGTPVALPR